MPLYLKNNCQPILFLHIPKTGGSTIESWLNTECGYSQLLFSTDPLDGMTCTPQHLGIKAVSGLVGDHFSLEASYVFAVVRNPFDRLISEFFYRVGLKQIRLGPTPEKYFSNWVNDSLSQASKKPHILDNHLRPQCYFVSDDVHVFKFETGIKSILETVAKANNQARPDVIASKKISIKKNVIWSKSAIRRVQEFYKQDFNQFGYDLECDNHREVHLNPMERIANHCVYGVRSAVVTFADG